MLKKIIFFTALAVGTFLGSMPTQPVFAAPNINELTADIAGRSGYDAVGTTEFTMSETIGKVIRVILSLVGTIFLVLTIYAGFLWMTAGGDEGKVEKAMDIIKMSTMGLVIVLAGYGLTTFIVGVITTTAGTPGGKIGPGAGNAGFWTSFGKSFKDNWWNYVF
jgi:hypothetical protein